MLHPSGFHCTVLEPGSPRNWTQPSNLHWLFLQEGQHSPSTKTGLAHWGLEQVTAQVMGGLTLPMAVESAVERNSSEKSSPRAFILRVRCLTLALTGKNVPKTRKFPEFIEFTEPSCRNQLRNCSLNVNYHLNPRVAQSSQFRPPAAPPKR